MRRVLIGLLVMMLLLIGCASTQSKTLDQLDKSLKINQVASIKVYKNISPDRVRDAAQKVFILMDKSDMKFDVRTNELLATRMYTFYAVFSVTWGRDWYSVGYTKEDNGTKVRFAFDGQENNGLIVPFIEESYRSNISVGAHNNPTDYKLFYDRIDYFLGLRSDWVTCDQAKKMYNEKSFMFLCDKIGIEDNEPDGNIRRTEE